MENSIKLRKWMIDNKVSTSIPFFLFANSYSSKRFEAINDLSLSTRRRAETITVKGAKQNVFILTGVPEKELKNIENALKTDGATQVISTKDGNGTYTVKAITSQFDDDGNTKILEEFLKLNQVTNKYDKVNEGLLLKWMKENGIKSVRRNITVLLFSKTMAGARQKAVKDLKLAQ